MGTGKTSAAITYFNEHSDGRYIFITPYLDEVDRIRECCPKLHFVSPVRGIEEYGLTKCGHTAELIKRGENIATTHQSFKNYTGDMLADIRESGYTLFIDENVDVLEKFEIDPDDFKLTIDAGIIKQDGDKYVSTGKEYNGKLFADMYRMLKSRDLMSWNHAGGTALHYWALPVDLITSFKDVFVLTYLFEGQSLNYFFKAYGLQYERIGIHLTDGGMFRFGTYPGYIPEYITNMKDKIHIEDGERINAVGDDQFALSKTWYERGGDGVNQLKLNVWNYFNNICKGVQTQDKLWGTYKIGKTSIRGKGYTSRYLTFNQKAVNSFRNCTHIAYLANVFMDIGMKNFYRARNVEVDEDAYALSIMVQWIWRSAIRDGKEINLYIPSKRMRTLLIDWMDRIQKGVRQDG